jgi:hypothetical protein
VHLDFPPDLAQTRVGDGAPKLGLGAREAAALDILDVVRGSGLVDVRLGYAPVGVGQRPAVAATHQHGAAGIGALESHRGTVVRHLGPVVLILHVHDEVRACRRLEELDPQSANTVALVGPTRDDRDNREQSTQPQEDHKRNETHARG